MGIVFVLFALLILIIAAQVLYFLYRNNKAKKAIQDDIAREKIKEFVGKKNAVYFDTIWPLLLRDKKSRLLILRAIDLEANFSDVMEGSDAIRHL